MKIIKKMLVAIVVMVLLIVAIPLALVALGLSSAMMILFRDVIIVLAIVGAIIFGFKCLGNNK